MKWFLHTFCLIAMLQVDAQNASKFVSTSMKDNVLVLPGTVPTVNTSEFGTSTAKPNIFSYEPIVYSDPVLVNTYKSKDNRYARGMEHLYLVTNVFLGLVQKEGLPADVVSNITKDNYIEVLDANKEELVTHYLGLVIVGLIGVTLAILFPLVGFFFCCCRCCGKCGGNSSPFDKKHDTCRRVFYGILVSCCSIIMLFGVVCAFMSNEYAESGIQKLPNNMNFALNDVSLYLNNTKQETHSVLVTNFQQLEVLLGSLLDKSGMIVENRLAEVSKALAIENLTQIVAGLEQIRLDLVGVVQNTEQLQFSATQLRLGLAEIRDKLQTKLRGCDHDLCRQLKTRYDLTTLSVEPDYKELPDVNKIAKEIAALIKDNIELEVTKGKDSLDRLSERVQQTVSDTIPEIKANIRQVGQEVEQINNEITGIINKVNVKKGQQTVDDMSVYLEAYAQYRYYVALCMACAVSIIAFCVIGGLFCGICGQKPLHHYPSSSCNKGTGANCLLTGIYMMFLLSSVLMLISTGFFLAGGVTQRGVCDPLEEQPPNPQVLQTVNSLVAIENLYPKNKHVNITLSEIISNCNKNLSLYQVLKLRSIVDISDVKNYKQRFRIDQQLEELSDRISINPSITILTTQAKNQLVRLASSRVSDVNFTSFTAVLERKVVSLNVTDLISSLDSYSVSIRPINASISVDLANAAIYLQGLMRNLIIPMGQNVHVLKKHLDSLETSLKFNKTNFREAIEGLVQQAENAQVFIQKHGREEMVLLAKGFSKGLTAHIDDYANRVENKIRIHIGKCWPLSQAYNSTKGAMCEQVIYPFNGFWASIGGMVILFIPTIMFGVILSSLYRKSDPYIGSLPESNRKKKNKRNATNATTSYENQNGFMHDYSPGFQNARPSSPPGRRGDYQPAPSYDLTSSSYKPVAPPHTVFDEWSDMERPPEYNGTEPNDSEYERPPPYYYPGPGPAS